MHSSALSFARSFFDIYCGHINEATVVDIGSQDVNGSIRLVCPERFNYIGVDFQHGKGVDIVLDDPYHLPLGDKSVDVIVCSSVFEHSQFFWLVFLEMCRVLKAGGLIYLNVPSNGYIHRYPVDSWRFYPDAGIALMNWANRHSFQVQVQESFIGAKASASDPGETWNDFVCIFSIGDYTRPNPDERIFLESAHCLNIRCFGSDNPINASLLPEDFILIKHLQEEVAAKEQFITNVSSELSLIKNSRIWRYTKPLRDLVDLFK